MSVIIGLVDYGLSGNIMSVKKAFEAVPGAKVKVIQKQQDFKRVDKIVLPGVGSFKEAMENIRKKKMEAVLKEYISKKQSLGICLGMQILSTVGFEFGETPGLGFIKAEVKRMEVKGKVPHIGWNNIEIVRPTPLLKGIGLKDKFYFMHSYEVVNFTELVALSEYCGHRFVSAVQKENIFGVQFHPEKSRGAGLRVIGNFIRL